MVISTLTLKLQFLWLNQSKIGKFWRWQKLKTAVANQVLKLPKSERRKQTSKNFNYIEIGSTWINQTLRNANAAKKVKLFKCLPLETNNQNWSLHQVNDTYLLGFGFFAWHSEANPARALV